jgi:hypothetical protein
MRRNEKRKLLRALADLGTALREATAVAESAVSALADTQGLLSQSEANADQWRRLCQTAQNRPVVVESVSDQIKPVNGWVN